MIYQYMYLKVVICRDMSRDDSISRDMSRLSLIDVAFITLRNNLVALLETLYT